MAYVALSAAESNLDGHPQAIVAVRRAYELRERVTLPVRLHIEDRYYEDATGEQEKAYDVLTQWVQSFPDDFLGHNNLSDCALVLGRRDQALAEAREAARLFPSPWSYGKVVYASIIADRFDDAKAEFLEADTRNFDNATLRSSRALLAFLQKDQSEMERQWNWTVGKPGADHMMLDARAMAEAYYGHFHDSLGSSTQAVDLALKYGSLNDATGYNDNLALREAEVGNLTVARHLANKSLGMVQSTGRRPILALALAQAGEVDQAQKLVDQINHDAPSDTLVQNYTLPSIRAALKLQTSDPAAAIEILRSTVKYDLASPIGFGSLYPAYIRGRAYLELREGRLAAGEFQKLLDHPGMVGRSVTGALSLLQMARAQ
jgi:tetratricopeptide (TPR) repeat protein